MAEHQIRGGKVVIDRKAGIIQFFKGDAPWDSYSLDEDWLQEYQKCRVCGKELPEELFVHAVDRHEAQTCSSKCTRKELIERYACCSKARMMNCVCMYAFNCPEHGETHIGSHD